MWRFLTGVKPPPQKKAKLSETDMDGCFLSSALKCAGFSAGQPRIHQGNQIHGFGCPAFEIGTTWIFFLISNTGVVPPGQDSSIWLAWEGCPILRQIYA